MPVLLDSGSISGISLIQPCLVSYEDNALAPRRRTSRSRSLRPRWARAVTDRTSNLGYEFVIANGWIAQNPQHQRLQGRIRRPSDNRRYHRGRSHQERDNHDRRGGFRHSPAKSPHTSFPRRRLTSSSERSVRRVCCIDRVLTVEGGLSTIGTSPLQRGLRRRRQRRYRRECREVTEEPDIFQGAPEQSFPVALNDATMPDDDSVEISGQERCHRRAEGRAIANAKSEYAAKAGIPLYASDVTVEEMIPALFVRCKIEEEIRHN